MPYSLSTLTTLPSPTAAHPLAGPPLCPRARFTVALPRANPTPRPLVPLDLNIGAFLSHIPSAVLPLTPGVAGAILVPQHIRHDKKPHVAPPDVDLIEMADSAVAGSDGDVLQLDVHVVFGCEDGCAMLAGSAPRACVIW